MLDVQSSGVSADRAVLISREGSLFAGPGVAGLDHERGNRRRDFISQVAPAGMPPLGPSPTMSTSPPILKLKPGGVSGAQTLVAGGSRVDLHDCRSARRHDIDLVIQRIRHVPTDTLGRRRRSVDRNSGTRSTVMPRSKSDRELSAIRTRSHLTRFRARGTERCLGGSPVTAGVDEIVILVFLA